jgi:hypothetical protein
MLGLVKNGVDLNNKFTHAYRMELHNTSSHPGGLRWSMGP